MLLVENLLSYQTFRDFQLVSGHNGLQNEVTGTAIFEWECTELVDKTFEEGEFVMTTLSIAKEDAVYAEKCLEILILKKVSAIAIKRIFFKEISKELKSLSNFHNIPIFFFSDIFFDDIIFTIKNALAYNTMNPYYEERVKNLLDSNLDSKLVEEIAKEINSSFHHNLICCYISLANVSNNNDLDYYYKNIFLHDINSKKDVRHYNYSVIKYNQCLLVIFTANTKNLKEDLMMFFDSIGFNVNNFVIGFSKPHYHLNNLGKAIKESIYTYVSCLINGVQSQDYDSIGLDKLLMPIRNDLWATEYYNNFFEKITKYDATNNTNFFNTLLEYVENDGNLQLIASKKFLHVNTIRYRVERIKEILNLEESFDSSHQLFVFVRLYLINKNLKDFTDL